MTRVVIIALALCAAFSGTEMLLPAHDLARASVKPEKVAQLRPEDRVDLFWRP